MTALEHDQQEAPEGGLGRRGFLGWVMAGTTLVVAADLGLTRTAATAAIPSLPQVPEIYDLEDLQTDAALPTANLITVTIGTDGTASFALPRMEVGQGIVTSTAMILAEELDLPVEKVKVTLAPARPELLFNQLTGGSNTTFSTFTPIRVAAAVARRRLLDAAAIQLGTTVDRLTTTGGIVSDTLGNTVTYGDLATSAASQVVEAVQVLLKSKPDYQVIGKPRNRTDAREAVTGRKKFTTDLDVPGALPTMVCRPPEHQGSPKRVRNKARVLTMPGVTHVAMVDTGVAVRAKTFGQCIDAIRELEVDWNRGTVSGESDQTVLAKLKAQELPMVVPQVPVLAQQVDTRFEFMFRSSAALEPYAAIADVREDRAEVWAGLKAPIVAQGNIAAATGLRQDQVKVNVVTGGGSFGHKLFGDHAIEAAKISKAMGVPVKLMWHRVDEPRQGRLHPMATSRVRATMLAGQVLSFEQRHTSVTTDFSHGLGEMITSLADELPTGLGGLGFAETIFTLTQELPYNFGVVTQLLNEPLEFEDKFSTGSMRNIYSPDTCVAAELTIDLMAKKAGKDPMQFRLDHVKNKRVRAVLEKVKKEGSWGRTMPKGMAQGVALHKEYKGATAVLVEIDCRPQTVNRDLGKETYTGPRVTKAVIAVDCGLVINPRGVEAQMQGGFMDGLAMTLSASNHLRDGRFLEGSWDNYFYTRQWNVPPEGVEVHIVDPGSDTPGGVGEAAVGSSAAAVACAYARATGTLPTRFPINHGQVRFKPKSFVPSLPASPTNGLKKTY
ncbi:molybdopterin cofactor-binding domain-containing protein [Nocardioides deserti]|uniref:Xanthine dehydrogenase family protein molybdopterin-binding subunit n=1 Tax=Nocardioides deserti TaxID=1588644 RepID=A0ABR6UBK7_9ACTN|nr:molybdopterin cofactor-binding domain-containing protein [Nocardioides deserti]MBC2961837.1 xanthine dehydrogenase family protein molybdopterin-binding subunit [Nocardioides deserti]GGO79437.1 isoquinoline 1-oxidoreductase subunit beta [Nocardioides deserti]